MVRALSYSVVPGHQVDSTSGDDMINSGSGNDVVYGDGGTSSTETLSLGTQGSDLLDVGNGNDTVNVAEGDSAQGGDGDDLFILTDHGEGDSSAITIDGGEGDETGGDTLNLNGLPDLSTLNLTSDTPDEKVGTVELLDGTLVTFSGIKKTSSALPPAPLSTRRMAPAPLKPEQSAGWSFTCT